MNQSQSEFLELITRLSGPEKAAAISHRIYALTASRLGWQTRVPERWIDLDDAARLYNIEAIRTWQQETQLLKIFVDSINDGLRS